MNNNPISELDTMQSRRKYRTCLPNAHYGECVEDFFTNNISTLDLASYFAASEEWAELFFDMATTCNTNLTLDQRRKVLYALTILRQYQLEQAQDYLDALNNADIQ